MVFIIALLVYNVNGVVVGSSENKLHFEDRI